MGTTFFTMWIGEILEIQLLQIGGKTFVLWIR
jgi:hypothetical protein